MRGGGIEVAAGGVLDAGVDGEGGGLAAAGDLDALGGRKVMDIVEVEGEIGAIRGMVLAELAGVGEAGEGVFAGDAGEVERGLHEAVEGVGGEVRRGDAGDAEAAKDAQAEGAGA